MSKSACVTLHLPPPDTFTLDRSLLLFSKRVTFKLGFNRAAVTAQKNPAAPPPITISPPPVPQKGELRSDSFLFSEGSTIIFRSKEAIKVSFKTTKVYKTFVVCGP